MSIKKTVALLALSASLATGPAMAGGMGEPMMEPEVIVEESGSSGDFVLPLLLLAIVVAIASSSDAPLPGVD